MPSRGASKPSDGVALTPLIPLCTRAGGLAIHPRQSACHKVPCVRDQRQAQRPAEMLTLRPRVVE